MKSIVFFNNKGGVGKTSLVYHLSWMYAELGRKILAADFDPQANLTSAFLAEDRLEELWPNGDHPASILGAIKPILKGTGDIAPPHSEIVAENIDLIVGDLGLATFEDKLSDAWPRCLDDDESAFRIISAFYRLLHAATETGKHDLILIDVGPNLGAINRAALIAAEWVVVPLAPDLFSLQGLRNLGPTLRRWRKEWKERVAKNPAPDLDLPQDCMKIAGYVIQQHAMRIDRPVKSYARWMSRIPDEYRESVLESQEPFSPASGVDPFCLSLLKHYRSLMPMAMEARKPMFFLKPADGAIGAHVKAVQDCYADFRQLAINIARQCDLPIS